MFDGIGTTLVLNKFSPFNAVWFTSHGGAAVLAAFHTDKEPRPRTNSEVSPTCVALNAKGEVVNGFENNVAWISQSGERVYSGNGPIFQWLPSPILLQAGKVSGYLGPCACDLKLDIWRQSGYGASELALSVASNQRNSETASTSSQMHEFSISDLHENDIIHANLKPENIVFVDSDKITQEFYGLDNTFHDWTILKSSEIRVIDFGGTPEGIAECREMAGTVGYRAPEIVMEVTNSPVEDIAVMDRVLGPFPAEIESAMKKSFPDAFDNRHHSDAFFGATQTYLQTAKPVTLWVMTAYGV
ncbi:hypothetical protein FB451DRAFT_1187975 [Mycena latifolia]|nr:hypothetical protein FB451DRAFT_1187975 [Mycena latifolia]